MAPQIHEVTLMRWPPTLASLNMPSSEVPLKTAVWAAITDLCPHAQSSGDAPAAGWCPRGSPGRLRARAAAEAQDL
eukprot:CAMPEP_0203891574 /NCGR_PEP_ID=MMETSP0359-20131031/34854_1 /ASSEMBLY_ACC=CAM_ASM_000338 /TAXON_ID=268821 /ORGANISM="Scrippsiella Hangoei, Strain SHTV-5" /LENGTH=75 /DNA_ID=CAMNT_0050813381 /DNA_START=48 /DNA_END=272 /DNA_ORIENTATION=-